MSFLPEQEFKKSAADEILISEVTPIFQSTAQYGIIETKAFSATVSTGTITTDDGMVITATGTTAGAYAGVFSRENITYRAGQGMLCQVSAIFSQGVANSEQIIGFITATDAAAFGFNGTEFGVLHRYGGQNEIQELTVTTAAAGAEVATVTVDGTANSVNLTAGTVQHNAYEIATQLNALTTGYGFSSNDDTVVAISDISAPAAGAFAFSSATAVAVWAEITNGEVPTDNWVAKSSWNGDDLSWLDPTLGNEYKIQYQYSGLGGGINFYVKDKDSNTFVLAHFLQYGNLHTSPSATNPSYRVGLAAISKGSTTDISISSAAVSAGIEGPRINTGPPVTLESTQTTTTTESVILMARNRTVFGGIRNAAKVDPEIISVSTESTKGALVRIVANPVLQNDINWQYLDKDNSITEFDDALNPVVSRRLIMSFSVVAGASQLIDLTRMATSRQAGDVVAVTIEQPATPDALTTVTMSAKEDL